MRYWVVGAGPAGCTVARELAESTDAEVTVLERRPHVAGNTYDAPDAAGVMTHRYGPHIFHTYDQEAYAFLSRFTAWYPLRHRVLANVHGKLLPVPFNLVSLRMAFGNLKAARMERALRDAFGDGTRVAILDLREREEPELRELAAYVYENIFRTYTLKQWGLAPDALDPAAMARVPVVVGEDCGYFQDPYQGVPADGYTALFTRLLDHPRIHVELNVDARERFRLEGETLTLDDEPCREPVIYTGALDELMGFRLGQLPYRTLDFTFETHPTDGYQPVGVVNYTVDEAFTRITEFKKLTGQKLPGVTTIAKEYSRACGAQDTPFYPIPDEKSAARYAAYRREADRCPNLILLGRLAEYRYYNIDTIVSHALEAGRLAAYR
ncbi:MAG: UDP-galactopyranose mutase [Eubacteriales bacterium]|nr:UDP-galactopyranose mutase [Eubacteriales bacterium]